MDKSAHRIIDCHVHLFRVADIAGFVDMMDSTGVQAVNLLALANPMPQWWAKPNTLDWHRRWFPRDVSVNVVSMMFKALYPERVFIFGSLDYNTPEIYAGQHDYARQARTLIDMGVDGFKMWMGPSMRLQSGVPLDSPLYDEYYSLLESASLPLTYHVGIDCRPEIDAMLPKHPRLKIIFAHFYGGPRDLGRVGGFLDTWPNTYIDLAPGMIFRGLSENRDEARKFFIKYQDRILFGTDASATTPQSVERGKLLVRFIRRFMERKDDLALPEIGLVEPVPNPAFNESQNASRREFWADHGLYLDDDVLAKIYSGNFARIAAPQPKRVNPRVVLSECEKLIDRVRQEPDDVEGEGNITECPHEEPHHRVFIGAHKTAHLQDLEQVVATFQAMV